MTSTAIYARISEDRESEGLGVERQEAACRALADQLGLNNIRVYIDNDISASTRSKKPRPGYKRMITAVEAGKIGHILAYSNSRLTRRPLELEALVDLHQRTGVKIRTVVSGQYDLATADGRMHARLLASIDAAEAERTSERVAARARQAAEKGKWHGGSRPCGYEADGVTVRESEAAEVRAGYGQVLAGASLGSIARAWNAAGLRAGRKRNLWTTSSVREALRSPRYAGLRSYRGEVVADAEWPALVDRDVWEAVVAILQDPARKRGPRPDQSLLSGLALCPCGETVHRSGRTETATYRCRAASAPGRHVARRAAVIDDYVGLMVERRLARDDASLLFEVESPAPDVAGLREKAEAYRARLKSAAVEFADGELTAEQLRVMTARLRERLAEVDAELASADDPVLDPFRRGENPVEVWRRMDRDACRAVIGRLAVVRILPRRGGRGPFDPESVVVEFRG